MSEYQPMNPGVRALFHFFGRCSHDHSRHEDWDGHVVSMLEQEIALVGQLHPDVGMSYGPPRVLLGADTSWADKGVFMFQFGAYGTTHVLAYGSLDDALEEAAGVLRERAPGHFVDVELPDGYAAMDEDEQDAARNEAEADLTYTESGYLASWEWYLVEMHSAAELLAYVYREG